MLSGTGRTLVNLCARISAGSLTARIVVVISSRADALAVTRARDFGLKTVIIERRNMDSEEFQEGLSAAIDAASPDLVCMAGFLSLWRVPKRFAGRVINIHPALLPDFGGRGMYGERVHRAVLAAGRPVSGCTVHYCDNEYDHGPIILQRRVKVEPNDTPATLGARVFEQELAAYPEAIQLFSDGRIRLDGANVIIDPPGHVSAPKP